jgi:ATP-dependent Clp protease ATP-binding subunit ClpA
MLEANESLESIFENAVKEAEKRRHEYVTIEHLLLSLITDTEVGTTLHELKVNVGAMIKDVESYLDTKCGDIVAKGTNPVSTKKDCFVGKIDEPSIHSSSVPRQTRRNSSGCAVEHICREEKLCISVP